LSRFEDAVGLVDRIFQFQTASEIESFVRRWMVERFPNDFTVHSSVQETKGSS
jgi:hypothetical protein